MALLIVLSSFRPKRRPDPRGTCKRKKKGARGQSSVYVGRFVWRALGYSPERRKYRSCIFQRALCLYFRFFWQLVALCEAERLVTRGSLRSCDLIIAGGGECVYLSLFDHRRDCYVGFQCVIIFKWTRYFMRVFRRID